jgi:hypothetical protein
MLRRLCILLHGLPFTWMRWIAISPIRNTLRLSIPRHTHVIALRTVPGNQLHRTLHLSFHRTNCQTARMPHRYSSTLNAHAGRTPRIHDGERDHVDVPDYRGVVERYSGEYGRGRSLPTVSFGTSANASCLDVISRFSMLFLLLAHR